jgi:hypothetical protein
MRELLKKERKIVCLAALFLLLQDKLSDTCHLESAAELQIVLGIIR